MHPRAVVPEAPAIFPRHNFVLCDDYCFELVQVDGIYRGISLAPLSPYVPMGMSQLFAQAGEGAGGAGEARVSGSGNVVVI